MWSNCRRRARLPPLWPRGSGDCLSHLWLWCLQRLPSRVHDFVHKRPISARLWLATRWGNGRLHDRRGKRPYPVARRVELCRWGAGGVWLWNRLRRARKNRCQWQRRGLDHRLGPCRPGNRHALQCAWCETNYWDRCGCRANDVGQGAWTMRRGADGWAQGA